MGSIALPMLCCGNNYIFLQVIDNLSGIAVRELYAGQLSDSVLEDEFSCEMDKLSQEDITYIDEDELKSLANYLHISEEILISSKIYCENENEDLAFQAWSPNKGLPYRLHTNREIILMLEGTKPLSFFIGRIPSDESFVEVPEHIFDPHVESGYLVKREIEELNPYEARGIRGHRVVLYARSGEEWRLDAYAIVRGVGNKIGWSEPLTRLEGILLGYAEWQNDAFIASAAR